MRILYILLVVSAMTFTFARMLTQWKLFESFLLNLVVATVSTISAFCVVWMIYTVIQATIGFLWGDKNRSAAQSALKNKKNYPLSAELAVSPKAISMEEYRRERSSKKTNGGKRV